jgi:hypothetical protein
LDTVRVTDLPAIQKEFPVGEDEVTEEDRDEALVAEGDSEEVLSL